ncbi:alpha/beta fold hydrolase [Maritalea sp.]|uniref:alpha/beta fold hydrolase n=1 Tax=Maritalea sp. TaxID=2003361 RepID=UPI003EF661AC
MKNLIDLTFEDYGVSDIPVVCLHGIGGNTDSFRPQLDELSKYARVIALNLPGYGGSRLISPVTFETLSNKLHDFLDAAGIERAVLLGQSIGGMVAIDFAIRFPERVEKLILVGTTSAFGGRDETFKDAFLKARLAPLDAGKSMAELANEFVPEIVGPIASPTDIANAVNSMSEVPLETYRAIIECLVTFNRREDLSSISHPTCLIAGEHDRNAPAKTMEKMALEMPNAAFHLVEGAGHLVNLEAGAATNAIVKKFLSLGG